MTTNTDLNLLPKERVQRRSRICALRRWGTVCVICGFVCSLPLIAVLIAPQTAQSSLVANAQKNLSKIQLSKETNTDLRAKLGTLSIQAEAVSMLERRIDWNGIFRSLAIAANSEVRFEGITCGTDDDENADRVDIQIRGHADSQGSARGFVVSLEQLGIFDSVTLNETSRVLIAEEERVQFRISLILDPALVKKGGKS